MIHLGLTDQVDTSNKFSSKIKSKSSSEQCVCVCVSIDRLFAEHTFFDQTAEIIQVRHPLSVRINNLNKTCYWIHRSIKQISERTFSINSIKLSFLRKSFPRKYMQCTVTNTVIQTHLNHLVQPKMTNCKERNGRFKAKFKSNQIYGRFKANSRAR